MKYNRKKYFADLGVHNMKKTDYTFMDGENTMRFYTYNVESLIMPTDFSRIYTNLKLIDIHGNKFNTAEYALLQKLDIAMVLNETTGKKAQIRNVYDIENGVGLISKGTFNVVDGGGNKPVLLSMETDIFDTYDLPEQTEELTQGFLPNDIFVPTGYAFMPLPAYFSKASGDDYPSAQIIDSVADEEPEEELLLVKINTPIYLARNTLDTYFWRSYLIPRKWGEINPVVE